MILLQAAASAAAFAKVGACLGAGLAAIGAGLGIGKSVRRPWNLSLANPSRLMISVPT